VGTRGRHCPTRRWCDDFDKGKCKWGEKTSPMNLIHKRPGLCREQARQGAHLGTVVQGVANGGQRGIDALGVGDNTLGTGKQPQGGREPTSAKPRGENQRRFGRTSTERGGAHRAMQGTAQCPYDGSMQHHKRALIDAA
jgi:hypothetical protein